MPFRYKEINDAIEAKCPGEARSTGERNKWIVLDGRRLLRVTSPQGHSGTVKVGTEKSIRNQLRLSRAQLADFVQCRLSGADYVVHLRALLDAGKI